MSRLENNKMNSWCRSLRRCEKGGEEEWVKVQVRMRGSRSSGDLVLLPEAQGRVPLTCKFQVHLWNGSSEKNRQADWSGPGRSKTELTSPLQQLRGILGRPWEFPIPLREWRHGWQVAGHVDIAWEGTVTTWVRKPQNFKFRGWVLESKGWFWISTPSSPCSVWL